MTSPTTLDRRELLKRVAYLMGGAISAPAVLGILQGCTPKQTGPKWTPEFFTPEQAAVVSGVVDIMIPRTQTPGALDAGVPQFIDAILKATYPTADQTRYLDGLQQFDAQASAAHGKSFSELTAVQREALVREVHDAAVQASRADTALRGRDQRPFIMMTKELAMLGFFCSEAGAKQVLQYNPVPGPFKGCLPLSDAGNGKTWASETPQPF